MFFVAIVFDASEARIISVIDIPSINPEFSHFDFSFNSIEAFQFNKFLLKRFITNAKDLGIIFIIILNNHRGKVIWVERSWRSFPLLTRN